MRLLRIPEPFDHPDCIFEAKFDSFRVIAYIEGHHCRLVSRNGHHAFGLAGVLPGSPGPILGASAGEVA